MERGGGELTSRQLDHGISCLPWFLAVYFCMLLFLTPWGALSKADSLVYNSMFLGAFDNFKDFVGFFWFILKQTCLFWFVLVHFDTNLFVLVCFGTCSWKESGFCVLLIFVRPFLVCFGSFWNKSVCLEPAAGKRAFFGCFGVWFG